MKHQQWTPFQDHKTYKEKEMIYIKEGLSVIRHRCLENFHEPIPSSFWRCYKRIMCHLKPHRLSKQCKISKNVIPYLNDFLSQLSGYTTIGSTSTNMSKGNIFFKHQHWMHHKRLRRHKRTSINKWCIKTSWERLVRHNQTSKLTFNPFSIGVATEPHC